MKKFEEGPAIDDWTVLAEMIAHDRWFWLRDRPIHPAMIRSMTWETLNRFMMRGALRIAVKLW